MFQWKDEIEKKRGVGEGGRNEVQQSYECINYDLQQGVTT